MYAPATVVSPSMSEQAERSKRASASQAVSPSSGQNGHDLPDPAPSPSAQFSDFTSNIRGAFRGLGQSFYKKKPTSVRGGSTQRWTPLGPPIANHYLENGGADDSTLSKSERDKKRDSYILKLVEDALLFVHHWIAASSANDTSVTFATQALIASNKVELRAALGSWLRTLTDLSWEHLWSVHGFTGVAEVLSQQFGFSDEEIHLLDSVSPPGIDPGEQISQDILSDKFDMKGLTRALAVEFYVKAGELSDRLLANIIRCILKIQTTTRGPFYRAKLSCIDLSKCSIPELERAIRAQYGNVHAIGAQEAQAEDKVVAWGPQRVVEFLQEFRLPELPDYITGEDLLRVTDDTLLWLHWTTNHVDRFRRCLSLYPKKDTELMIEVEFYTVQAMQKCLQGIRERNLILPQVTIIHGEDSE